MLGYRHGQREESPEEGEIFEDAAVVATWSSVDIVWTWLNLAMYELLSGNASAAFDACERGLEIAEGELKVRSQLGTTTMRHKRGQDTQEHQL